MSITARKNENWIKLDWDKYVDLTVGETESKFKSYYYNGRGKIEMSPIGSDHAAAHTIIIVAVSLFAAIKGVSAKGMDNCSYRKVGFQEAQPDVSYYLGENADVIPWGTSIIDLDVYPAPDLVIEVANTSLADDRGEKRLLHEDLSVKEYWIVDVQNVRLIAFQVELGGSRRISESQILPGLEMSLLEDALRRTRELNQSQVIAWLLSEFQQ